MNITRLRLTDFRRHENLDIELKPGLNIVRGPNEAGKSTVQRAIEVGLFRRATFASNELGDLKPWHNADADPVVEVDFDDNGTHGSLRKVFGGPRGTVELTVNGEAQTDPAAVDAEMARMTGIPSEKFMRSTASVHHHELAGLDKDESTLRDRLQQSMSGADRGTQAARKKLEDSIRRYRTEGAKNPGYLKVLRADVDRLTQDTRSGEQALQQLEADRRALATARATRATLDQQIAANKDNAAKAERAVQLTTRSVEATKRYTTFKKAVELREEVARLDASHPSRVALPVLRSTVDHVRQLEFKLSEMRAELAAEPDLSSYDVAIPNPRWQPWMAISLILLFVGLVAVGVAVLGGMSIVPLAVGVVLLAAGVAVFFVARGQRNRLNDVRMQNELREAEIARRLSGRTQLAEKVRQTDQERTEALGSLGTKDLGTAERLLNAEADHVAQSENRRAEYRGLMGKDVAPEAGSDDLATQRDQAAAEIDECKHTLAGMGTIGQDPSGQLATFNAALQRLGPERDQARQDEANADARVSNNPVDAEKVAASSESLEQANEQLEAAERRVRIYEDVLTTLDAAEQGTMKKAARFLEKRMASDIETITDGRYRRLKVDEQSLTFSVFAPELDNWIDVSRLSQGTLDQLYLCARLGIVRQVTEPGTPPLVFDDPFVTFDADRAERALRMLKELASDFQVIFITSSDRYDAVADNVIVLPGPTARDEKATVDASATGEAISMWTPATLPAGPAEPAATASASPGGRPAANPPAPPVSPLWPPEEH